jgi:hypothetical protein
MKKLHLISGLATAVVLSSTLLLTNCTKAADGTIGPAGPAGATGPAGAAGPAGPAGAAGAKGDQGNAEVRQIVYTARTHTGSDLSFKLTSNFTKEILDRSMILVYIKASNNYWYMLPGFTAGGTNNYRIYINADDPTIWISRVTGSGSDVWNAVRIVAVPANIVTNGRQAGIDYTDYEAVKVAYNLPD